MSQQFSKDAITDGVQGQGESLFLGILAGIIAAIVGALIWMGITVVTNMHIGYVALGVGALVGAAIRFAGKGTGKIYGICGAVLTFLGCMGGEILTVAQLSATPEHNFLSTLMALDLVQLVPRIFQNMDPIMYLIYAIGIYEGYKLSIRK